MRATGRQGADHGRRGIAAAAVAVCLGAALLSALLAGCGGDGSPGDGTGPVPDPERDGCAPYDWYADGAVPVRLGAAWIGGLIEDIAVDGSLAVLASRACGLRVVDVADPAAPRLLGVTESQQAVAADLHGTLAAAAEGDRGFSLYDLSDPARPVRLSRTMLSGGTSSYTDAVELAWPWLFVSGFHRQLVCYDVRDPRQPVEKGRLVMDRPGALALVGDRLFAGGRFVVRVGPQGTLTPVQDLGLGAAEDLLVLGTRVVAVVASGVAAFDTADSAAVVRTDLRSATRARCLAAAGGRVYVGIAPPTPRLKVFDLTAEGRLELAADVRADEFAAFYSLAPVAGTLLAGDRWLRAIDLADPLAPVFAAPPPEPAYAQGLAVCGDHAVVADGPLASVYALGQPAATTPLVTHDLGQSILHMAANSGYVYVARNGAGLVVLHPAAGSLPALQHASEWFGTLAVSDSLLLTGVGGSLRVYGLQTPGQPAYLGELDFNDYVRAIALDGDRALVSLAERQLVLLDLANPRLPREVARDPDNVVFNDSAALVWADSLGFDYHVDGLLRVVRPNAEGLLVTVNALATPGQGRGLVRVGPVLYALSGQAWGGASHLNVYDLADPVRPAAAGRAVLPEATLTELVHNGGFIYALTTGGVLRFWPDCRSLD